VKPADLSIEARRCILLHDGYRNVLGISYDRDYNTGVCYSNWGIVDLIVDAVTPSTDQISAAILTEMATVQARRAEAEAKRAEAEALAARRQEARLLLADEFDAAAKKLAAAEAVAAQRLTRIGELEDEANDEE
jgi:regulator of protease activity HflC (stomatin/prohibitin superfamily)